MPIRGWLAVLLTLGLLVGCRQTAEPASTPALTPVETTTLGATVTASDGVELTVVAAGSVTTLDPYRMRAFSIEEGIAAHIWDTLVWINEDLELESRLAESWYLVSDYVWEFRLRPGVLFHNGESFDAEAARFSLLRAATLEDSLETFATDVSLESVELVDENVIRIRTQEPAVNLPYQLATVEMLPRGYYESAAEDELAQQPVGSGPYRFVSWDPEGLVIVEANPDYWQGVPVVQSILFATEPQVEQRLAYLASGVPTLIADIPPDRVGEVEETPGMRLAVVEGTRRMFVGIHVQENTPLADKRVRRALNYAVDVEIIVNELMGGYGERYASWVNGPDGNMDLTPWPYDPERAQELLAEAGYADGFSTEVHVPADHYQRGREVAEAIVNDLAQVGVQCEVKVVSWSDFVRELLDPDQVPPLFLLGLNSRADGLEDTENLAHDFPFNPTQWFDAEFEGLLGEARQVHNDVKRTELLRSAQAIAYEAAPWIWLWRPNLVYGVSQELDWWQPRADGLIYLYTPAPGPTID